MGLKCQNEKNFTRVETGHILENFWVLGPSLEQFESFSMRSLVTISLTVVDTFWPISTRSRWGHGYIHGPCTTACIFANTAWNLPKNLLGILYQKLSIIMLIRRFTGCFECHFQIFGILGNYLSWPWASYYGRYGQN